MKSTDPDVSEGLEGDSRKPTTPGLAPRPPTVLDEPGARSALARRNDHEAGALDELAQLAKATPVMPERSSSDGAKNARYAAEGRPAQVAKVTMPTGEVLVEPLAAAQGVRIYDTVPEGPPPGVEIEARDEGDRESDEAEPRPDKPERVYLPTAPSVRVQEKRAKMDRATKGFLGVGVGLVLVVLAVGFLSRKPTGSDTPSIGIDVHPAAQSSTNPASSTPATVATGPSGPRVVAVGAGTDTSSPAASAATPTPEASGKAMGQHPGKNPAPEKSAKPGATVATPNTPSTPTANPATPPATAATPQPQPPGTPDRPIIPKDITTKID
jgi:hypothetical protein